MLRPDSVLLTDRVVVVTGAAGGIGRATARACAAFGADIAMCDRDVAGLAAAADEVRAEGRRAVTGVLDVRDADAVAAHLASVGAEFGRVDVLVNNAGGGFAAPFLDVSAKGHDALVHENFTSVTHFVRGCVPLMPAGGSIVNITSVEAHRASPNFAIYAAMKAAVESLTRTLALELADRRIRVNCVAPDAIPTDGDAALIAAVQGDAPRTPYATPLPFEGEPDDCAAAIVFLASSMARFITGTTIHVGGGTDAARGWHRNEQGRWVP